MTNEIIGVKPAIELVEKSLDKLKEKGKITGYTQRDRRSRGKDSYLYYMVSIGKNTCFELQVSRLKDSCRLIWDSKHSKIFLSLGFGDRADHHQVANWLITAMSHMKKDFLFSGFNQENHYAQEVLEKMKKSEIILDYYFPSQREDYNGIDLCIVSHNKVKIPLQIKSSPLYQLIHMRRYPHIPSIVTKDKSVNDLNHLTMRIIKSYESKQVLHL